MTQVVILTKSDYTKILRELQNARKEIKNEDAKNHVDIALNTLRQKG